MFLKIGQLETAFSTEPSKRGPFMSFPSNSPGSKKNSTPKIISFSFTWFIKNFNKNKPKTVTTYKLIEAGSYLKNGNSKEFNSLPSGGMAFKSSLHVSPMPKLEHNIRRPWINLDNLESKTSRERGSESLVRRCSSLLCSIIVPILLRDGGLKEGIVTSKFTSFFNT